MTTAPTSTPTVFLPPPVVDAAPVSTAIPRVIDSCTDGVAAVAECLVSSNSSYTYSSLFGGRVEEGVSLTASEGTLSVVIPKGFYEKETVTIKDTDLVGTNVLAGKTIFGITGDLDNSANNNCAVAALLNSEDPNPATCNFTSSNGYYAYQSKYGGRASNCNITESAETGSSTHGPCWLAVTQGTFYIYDKQVYYPPCTSNSKITVDCKASAGHFLYSEIYGGRSIECPIDTMINYKCYVNSPNMKVYNIVTCKEDPNVDAAINNNACFPSKIGNWVYGSPYGGRGDNCLDNNSGNCYFQFEKKSASAANLVAENIKSGETILGVDGNFITEGFYWGSGAHRTAGDKRMVYQKPPGPTPTAVPYVAAESELSAASTAPLNYRFVPKIATDTEAPVTANKVDRSLWGDVTCGTNNGDISAKISNCANNVTIGSMTTWNGILKGNAGQGIWKLVARKNISAGVNYEVWQDTSTGLLWSSRVSNNLSGLNWCKASGSSFSAKIDEKMREDDPAGICNSTQYQNNGSNHPISACVEGYGGYLTDDSVSTSGFLSTGTKQEGKAGLKSELPAAKANGRIFWRLPTIYDYILANHDGLRYVLPDSESTGEEWTATTFSGDRAKAWTINIANGSRRVQPKYSGYAVRCIGR